MASEIPEIVYAFDPQLKFMEVGILLTYLAVSCSSLREDSAEFRYVPLYIADQVEFRCCFSLRSKRFGRVWEQRKTKERGFRYFACAENGARAKKRTVGVGEGKEGTACGQTPGF